MNLLTRREGLETAGAEILVSGEELHLLGFTAFSAKMVGESSFITQS